MVDEIVFGAPPEGFSKGDAVPKLPELKAKPLLSGKRNKPNSKSTFPVKRLRPVGEKKKVQRK